ncbi:MAG: hypothetical protein J6034_02435 [Bacteroidaceae bacterium]|nr:hypothetical protein [Bacteroidaceae bacterium]
MKKRSFLLLALTVIVYNYITASCGYIPKRSDYTFRTEVRTTTEDGEVRWDTIVIYLTDSKNKTQIFYSQAQPLDTMSWSKENIGTIEEEDWNFDGIPDLQVCRGTANGYGNLTYDVWIWNDKAHKYYNSQFKIDNS